MPGSTEPAVRRAEGSFEFGSLTGDAVMVLPLHGAETNDTAGSSKIIVEQAVTAFDRALEDTLGRVVGQRWVWASQLRALHKRNPLTLPDPAKLAVEPLLARRRTGVTLAADLATDIRRLLGVSGARRYVILPFALELSRVARGFSGEVGIALIDARASELVAIRTVVVSARPDAHTAAIATAAAVRSVFTPDSDR